MHKVSVSSAQPERILDLTVEIDGDINTLEGALRRFTSSEVLDGDNRYHCSRCMSYERAKKKLAISEAPNILTIALKRYQSGIFGKISKDVKFPEHLNLSQFMCETDDYSPVYSLYAVVVHHDVISATISGHYVCYMKDPQGNWHEMDDSKVKPVSLKKVLSKCAYMLLYARCSPRAPDSVRKAMPNQDALHAKKPKDMTDSESTPLGGGSHVNTHQCGKLCKDHAGHNLTYTSDASDTWRHRVPGFRRSDSSSLFSNSDAGSSSTVSSDSTDSTRNSASVEYDYIFGTSDHMRPVSSAVIPEEDELSYLRQRSSFDASSSGHDMDQAGELTRQYHPRLQVGRGGLEEGGENPSFSYTDQGKHQGSSSRRSSHHFSRNCKLTEQRRYTGAAFFLEGQLGRGLSKHFTDTGGLRLLRKINYFCHVYDYTIFAIKRGAVVHKWMCVLLHGLNDLVHVAKYSYLFKVRQNSFIFAQKVKKRGVVFDLLCVFARFEESNLARIGRKKRQIQIAVTKIQQL